MKLWVKSPALNILLQGHHHGEMLVQVWLAGSLTLASERIVHQFQLTLPWQDVGMAIVKAQWNLGTGIGAAIAANHSDLGRNEWRRHQN